MTRGRPAIRLVGGRRAMAALLLVVPLFVSAQTPSPTPRPQQVLVPQPFQPNISNTEGSLPAEEANTFSPWYDVRDDVLLPHTFNQAEAAEAALNSTAEAAASASAGTSQRDENVPLDDLFIEDSGGALLTTPEGSLFTSEALLFNAGNSPYADFSKESSLPYGEFSYPLLYVPRAVPVFKRVRHLNHIGPFRVAMDVGASAAYNNNVFGESSNPQSDEIYTLLPELYLEAGTRGTIRFLYAPTFVNFSRYKELSKTNQALSLQVKYPFTKLKLQADVNYFSQSGLFVNSTGYSVQQTFLARLFGEYPLTRKSMLGFGIQSVWQKSNPGDSQTDNSANMKLAYQVASSFKAGISFGAGVYDAPSDNQTYESAQLSLAYRAGEGLSFAAEAGLELRQMSISNNGQDQLALPIFNFQINYNPTSTTLFNVTFFRNVLNTTFNDVSLSITTGVSTSVLIRFFEKVNFRLEMGFGYTEQLSNEKVDDGRFCFMQGGVTVSYPLLRWVEIQAFANVQQRFASQVGNDYISNSIGAALLLKF